MLFVGDDGCLGKTIGPVVGWDEAIRVAAALAKSMGHKVNAADHIRLKQDGDTTVIPDANGYMTLYRWNERPIGDPYFNIFRPDA